MSPSLEEWHEGTLAYPMPFAGAGPTTFKMTVAVSESAELGQRGGIDATAQALGADEPSLPCIELLLDRDRDRRTSSPRCAHLNGRRPFYNIRWHSEVHLVAVH